MDEQTAALDLGPCFPHRDSHSSLPGPAGLSAHFRVDRSEKVHDAIELVGSHQLDPARLVVLGLSCGP